MNALKDKRLWVSAYKWIKESIHSGNLVAGEPLSENRLAQEIKISRTPIREALTVLSREGYIRIIPGKGAFVSEISMEDMKEIYDIRKLLEPYAAMSAIHRISEGEILALEKDWQGILHRSSQNEAISWGEIAIIDQRFHFTLIRHSTNKRIQEILSSYYAQIERFLTLSARSLANMQDTAMQHLKLIECIKQKDEQQLAISLHHHIVRSEEIVLKNYFGK